MLLTQFQAVTWQLKPSHKTENVTNFADSNTVMDGIGWDWIWKDDKPIYCIKPLSI